MPLPVLADLKAYLRVESTAEDTVLTGLLARAKAMVEGFLRRPITAVSRSMVVNGYGTLHLPLYPVNPTGLTVHDVDATLVGASTYRIDQATGMIIADADEYFDNGPYTIVAEVGLSLHEDYASVIEPVLSQAIIDVAADIYQHRNPASTNESTAGVSVSYPDYGMPSRVAIALAPYRRTGVRA